MVNKQKEPNLATEPKFLRPTGKHDDPQFFLARHLAFMRCPHEHCGNGRCKCSSKKHAEPGKDLIEKWFACWINMSSFRTRPTPDDIEEHMETIKKLARIELANRKKKFGGEMCSYHATKENMITGLMEKERGTYDPWAD